MTPDEIHQWVAERQTQVRQSPRAPREARPADVKPEDWKNRNRKSVKLNPHNNALVAAFMEQHNLAFNATLNFIITDYFHG